ncbi:MAG: hypothetical protein NTU89_03915 [Candidatus Dependentiae bacterium]|nr:hypothetical protein [Candidatus Dependentiae bacterium]
MLAFFSLANLSEFCAQQLGLYTYQNYIELFFFVLITNKTLTWLKKDHTKHLLFYTYSYFALLFASYSFSCTILFSSMIIFSPALVIFCIVIHQKQIQKNFVFASLKQVSPSTIPDQNWLEVLIRSCLLSSYQKKQLICIVQRFDHLGTLLQAPYELNLPVQQDIVDLILASNDLDNPSILWADQSGILCSVNVKWKKLLSEEVFMFDKQSELHPLTHHHATISMLTKKTDSFAFLINASTGEHALWYQGKCCKQITIDQLLKSCKQIINLSSNAHQESIIASTFIKQAEHIKGKNNDQKNNSSHTSPPLH